MDLLLAYCSVNPMSGIIILRGLFREKPRELRVTGETLIGEQNITVL